MISGKALVLVLVSLIFVSALLPEMITQVEDVDTDSWNFTGDTGAATLWRLTPFVVIAGIVIAILGDLISGS
jgi:hypothetical protein